MLLNNTTMHIYAVKHSGYYIYTCFNIQTFYFVHRVCFYESENKQTVIVSQNINWLAFIMEMEYALCEVGTGFSYSIWKNFKALQVQHY